MTDNSSYYTYHVGSTCAHQCNNKKQEGSLDNTLIYHSNSKPLFDEFQSQLL
ncbi:hypothetical protein HanPSC8_Chr02g0076651 [Helianthus annuus]|nr:hypothetical protein HanPSC8_Chr02g0076651 [Helianthus annuus]